MVQLTESVLFAPGGRSKVMELLVDVLFNAILIGTLNGGCVLLGICLSAALFNSILVE